MKLSRPHSGDHRRIVVAPEISAKLSQGLFFSDLLYDK